MACQPVPMISSCLQTGYYISACGSELSLCFYFVFSLRFVSDKEVHVDHSLTREHCLSNLSHGFCVRTKLNTQDLLPTVGVGRDSGLCS